MDGLYLNKNYSFTESHKTCISTWIMNSVKDDKWEEGNDLHIDEIISDEIPESKWIDISFSLIKFANEEIIRLGLENIIPIVFIPLYGYEFPRGITFNSIHDIEDELDLTPPSLFICSEHWPGFIEAYANRKLFSIVEFRKENYLVYYYEELHDNGLEYVRNVSLIPEYKIKFL